LQSNDDIKRHTMLLNVELTKETCTRFFVTHSAIWQATHKIQNLPGRLLESILATAQSGCSHNVENSRCSGWRNDKPLSSPQISWHHDFHVSHCIRLLACMLQNHRRSFSSYTIDHFRWRVISTLWAAAILTMSTIYHITMSCKHDVCAPRSCNLFSLVCHLFDVVREFVRFPEIFRC